MADRLDIVLINPGDRKQVYQDLGTDYSGIEPPYWLAVIAAYLRNSGFRVGVIDANAENFSPEETSIKVRQLAPLLSAVIVFGTQPSASTQNMTIAGRICAELSKNTASRIAIGGLHPSALPRQTLEEEKVHFVIEGEGPYTLKALIAKLKSGKEDYADVPGLWYRKGADIAHNPRPQLIRNLNEVFSIAAWDMLPMQKYRAHNWHCFDHLDQRTPYAAIYTGLGCPYNCAFCCINALFGKPGIRYRSPESAANEMGLLRDKYGVKNLKIIDELFILDKRHYMPIVELLIERGYDFNIWAYARVDTIRPQELPKLKKAGINWIALGIESANPKVRDSVFKKMNTRQIKNVVNSLQGAGIRVIGNFIFGLPDDTLKTMQETLDLALELNCEFVNFYYAMAYPGSRLYEIASKQGWKLPDAWHGFSQHSYEALPLPTKFLSAEEVLRFRDEAFNRYFTNPDYLNMIEAKFGARIRGHISEMAKKRLPRMIFEDKAITSRERSVSQ